jgi:anti-sigma factor RsiW
VSLVLPRHLTCREIVELVTSYDDGDLDATDCGRFEEHLATCGACVTYYDQMRQTSDAIGALGAGDAGDAGSAAGDAGDPPLDPPLDPLVERSLLNAFRDRLGPEAK